MGVDHMWAFAARTPSYFKVGKANLPLFTISDLRNRPKTEVVISDLFNLLRA